MVIGSTPIAPIYHREKDVFIIKIITQKEMNTLLKNGIIKHTARGIVSKDGKPTGFYRTKTNRYIEDKYVDIAKSLS